MFKCKEKEEMYSNNIFYITHCFRYQSLTYQELTVYKHWAEKIQKYFLKKKKTKIFFELNCYRAGIYF